MSTLRATLSSALASPLEVTAAFSGLAGIITHLIIRPLELDTKAFPIFWSYLGVLASLGGANVWLCGFSPDQALLRTFVASTAFNFGLFSSILLYRAFFHRLHRFPGPFGAKLSRFYATRLSGRKLKMNEEILNLHEKYGDFVRLGPREISINRAAAIPILYEPPVQCIKAPWYTQVADESNKVSLAADRHLASHRDRKKAWMRGLGPRALATYEDRIVSKIDLLLSRFEEEGSIGTDISRWFAFFAFDVMGQVGFSKDFDLLKTGKNHAAIKGVRDSMITIAVGATVPWLLGMLTKIPGATGSYERFMDWCREQLELKRVMMASEKPHKDEMPKDVISWLLRAEENNDRSAPPAEEAFQEDARVLIIAGSDTTSAVLTNTLFYLTQHPAIYRKLQQILDGVFPGGNQEWTYEKAKPIAYIDYIIQESLRLKPSVPAGLVRMTPPKGIQVDEVFIPGNTIVSVPTYTIHRDARYWDNPLQFVPERWETIKPERSPWIPFGRGEYICAGKALAFMEMRMALSKIALRYDMAFAPGFDVDAFDNGSLDTFTLSVPELRLVFTQRD